MDKNPLTKLKIECIINTANEKIASLNYGSTIIESHTTENRRVVICLSEK